VGDQADGEHQVRLASTAGRRHVDLEIEAAEFGDDAGRTQVGQELRIARRRVAGGVDQPDFGFEPGQPTRPGSAPFSTSVCKTSISVAQLPRETREFSASQCSNRGRWMS